MTNSGGLRKVRGVVNRDSVGMAHDTLKGHSERSTFPGLLRPPYPTAFCKERINA